MAFVAGRLASLDELRALETMQTSIIGRDSPSAWSVPQLVSVVQSGGLLLGVRDEEMPEHPLVGALVDLLADSGGHSSLHTAFRAVSSDARNRGCAQILRHAERFIAKKTGVAVITWAIDPLRSVEAHIAFNKLGAIATGHARNLYGDVGDRANRGLATDRLHIEWWLEAPRTLSVCDRGQLPPHYRLGLHEMTVWTQTTLHASGVRAIVGHRHADHGRHVLVEIPVDLDRLRASGMSLARDWRLATREAFELLFEKGYVVVGFVHEGGRSFHLLERTSRGAVLGSGG